MKKYARIVDGEVFETLELADDLDISECFHPSLIWVECSPEVEQRWLYDGVNFSSPLEE